MGLTGEARRAYMRKYRAANYEKLSAYYSDRRRKKSRDTAFGAFLRENGITQTAAAKMLGVSVSTANNWANGITTAREDKIHAVWPEYGGENMIHYTLNVEPPVEPPAYTCPICPVCGAETGTVYKNVYGDPVGCPECVTEVDAWAE